MYVVWNLKYMNLNLNLKNNHFELSQQYADDISYISDSDYIIEKQRNLNVNRDKTEEYKITRNGSEEWKKSKYLGSLLETQSDITRRNGLAIHTCNMLKHIKESQKLNIDTKIRVFDTFVTSVFLFNCELWTLRKAQEEQIDTFQRKQLRRIIKIRWPRIISNQNLYDIIKVEKWSKEIKRRRLSWLGHLLRLPEEATTKRTLYEALRPVKKPKGKPKLTWLGLIDKDLGGQGLNVKDTNKLKKLANNRNTWSGIIRLAMSGTDVTT